MAAERPATDVLEALLKAGAEPNVLDNDITAICEMLVRALHAGGVSARETFSTGKTVEGLIKEHVPAMLPLITELAAKEAQQGNLVRAQQTA